MKMRKNLGLASDELDCKISDAISRSMVTPEEHISRQTDAQSSLRS